MQKSNSKKDSNQNLNSKSTEVWKIICKKSNLKKINPKNFKNHLKSHVKNQIQ